MKKVLACLFFVGLSLCNFINAANPGDVVINEIAWMGTDGGGYSDEWIELYNTTNTAIDLTGWTIKNVGYVTETFTGTIPANGYYLIENDEDCITDIQSDFADATLKITDSGTDVLLIDNTSAVIDEVDCSSGWFAGTNNPDYTMERIDPCAEQGGLIASNWATNNGITYNGLDKTGGPIHGTPKADNSVLSSTCAGADTTPPTFAGVKTVSATGNSGELYIAWDSASDPSTPIIYNVYRATVSGGQNFSTPDTTISSLSFRDKGLVDGTTYYYVVRAKDSYGNEDTNTVEKFAAPFYQPDTTPPYFKGIKTINATGVSGEIYLTWDSASDSNPVTYNVYRSLTSLGQNFSSPIANVSSLNFTDSGLTDGTTYYYIVRAVDSQGNEDSNMNERYTAPRVSTGSGGGSGNLEVYFVDVGQGDGTLIVTPSGKSIVMDCNRGKGADMLPFMENHVPKITTINYMIASHYHSDHIGGLDEIINGSGGYAGRDVLDACFDHGGSYTTTQYTEYVNAVTSTTGGRKTAVLGDVIDLGDGVTFQIIASNRYVYNNGGPYGGSTDENAYSVSIKLNYKNFDLWVAGDLEAAEEAPAGPICGDVDVYQCDHHGSDTSSDTSFLDAIKPEVTMISVGDGNSYGHPKQITLDNLAARNSYVYQTELGNGGTLAPGAGEVMHATGYLRTDGCSEYLISYNNANTKTYPCDETTYSCGDFNFGLKSVWASSLNTVEVLFTDCVNKTTTENNTYYTIYETATPSNIITVNSGVLHPGYQTVSLDTSNLTPGVQYTIELNTNILDYVGHNLSATLSTGTFVAPQDILTNTDPIFFPEWSHDGTKIAYIQYDRTTGISQIWVQNRDGTGRYQVTNGDCNVFHASQISFSYNDNYIVFSALTPGNYTQLRKVPSAGGSSTPFEPPSSTNWGRWVDPHWTSSVNQISGTEMVVCSISGDLWVFDPATIETSDQSLEQLTTLTTSYTDTYAYSDKMLNPHWSPDNTKITFVRRLAGTGVVDSDIYVLNNVQNIISSKTPVTSLSDANLILISQNNYPSWSPSISVDNTQISYVTDINNKFDNVSFWTQPDNVFASANFDSLYEKSDGTQGSPGVLENNPYNEGFMKWAPAGGDQFVYVFRKDDGSYGISVINHPVKAGFVKGGILKVSDYSLSSAEIESYTNIINDLSIESPLYIPGKSNIPGHPIGEYRLIKINSNPYFPYIMGNIKIHFMNSEIRNSDVKYLKLFYYDELSNSWEMIPSSIGYDKLGGALTGRVNNAGYYAISSLKATNTYDNFSAVRVYPNPFVPGDNDINTGNYKGGVIIDKLPDNIKSINIYNISGEKISKINNGINFYSINDLNQINDVYGVNFSANSSEYGAVAIWNCKNSHNNIVSSGIYIVVIEDTSGDKCIKKLAIIK